MAGIKDLLSLFYWINNQKESFMDASVGQSKPGNHQSDNDLHAPAKSANKKAKSAKKKK